MHADILEQVVEEYLQHRGYFTMHNVRFKPDRAHLAWEKRKDDVSSDVDVIGINPLQQGTERVWVVSCKAWQSGFHTVAKLDALQRSLPEPSAAGTEHGPKSKPRPAWKYFRELSVQKWSEAFRDRVFEVTGQREFHYFMAVTRLIGDPAVWSDSPLIKANLANNPFGFLTMEGMWNEVLAKLGTTPAATSIGRLAQLLKAARLSKSGNQGAVVPVR
jgi:hypothetical protein